jgi:Ca2+-transporting ATPase
MTEQPKKSWTFSIQQLMDKLDVLQEHGLDSNKARQRLKQFGPNRLQETKRKSVLIILINQLNSLIVLLLVAAALVSFAFGETIEGFAILVVIFINTAMGFITELRAVRSMEALKKLGGVNAKVRRNGQLLEIAAEEIVPGDIVIVEGGDIITADIRIIQASKLQCDESALTGESLPVNKNTDTLKPDVPLAERKNMLYKGTALTRGSGEGIVVATGMDTELGKISSLVQEAEQETTPLEKRLNQLGHKLIWVTLVIAGLIAFLGLLTGKELFLMIETAIALAVAAIPEGLPIVATIALARGMWRMAKRNALINHLSAVETLGATTVIFTDKTGTLTENRMTVTRIILDSGEVELNNSDTDTSFIKNNKSVDPSKDVLLQKILKIGILCNNASIGGDKEDAEKTVGDPLETALLSAGIRAGLRRSEIIQNLPEVAEEAFDSDIKMMATYHKENSKFLVAVKGAPEEILNVCSGFMTEKGKSGLTDAKRKHWLEYNRKMAETGLRVLGIAEKSVNSEKDKPYKDLTFIGLIGLLDPPRSDVRQAVQSCRNAGIRVIMVTGDQPVTAQNIAHAVGLTDDSDSTAIHGREIQETRELKGKERQNLLAASVFARVSPRQKLDLVDLHQKNDAIVAMTGDGVNDAPALKEADIGVAMGLRGTQVAREASDMVLKDDKFSTIVEAVQQGRIIFNNIRKSILYLLSCNISEVMSVGLASFVNAPLPILPLQILFLNLVTDVFPALALAVGKGDPGIMKKPPRPPGEPIITKNHWKTAFVFGFIITISVLGSLALSTLWLKLEQKQAVSVSFLTLAFAQLWHVFNMRAGRSGLIKNDIVRNPFIWISLVLCTGLLLAAVYVPGLALVLKVADPGIKGWILVLVMSMLPLFTGQLIKLIRKK